MTYMKNQNNPPFTQPLIALAVIVGNEEKVIERFIRGFYDVADTMSFVMAIGNRESDGTEAIIHRVCQELKMPYGVHHYKNKADFPHVDNFGAARQVAWEMAQDGGPKYLLWADCDDTLDEGAAEAMSNAATEGAYDVFVCPYKVRGDIHAQQIVHRERLILNNGRSHWRYPIHEQLRFDGEVSYKMLDAAKFVHSPDSTKSGSRERNVAILETRVQDNARNYFYLHQEHFEGNNIVLAKKFGLAALHAPGLETLEKYETLLNLAQLEPGAMAKKRASEAFELMPDRREALALLVNYAIIDGNHDKAMTLCRMMMGIPKPTRTYWSLNHLWYGWKGAELYAQCLRLSGGDIAAFEELYNSEDGPTFSIVHATLARPLQALQMRELWMSRAKYPNRVEYIFGTHEGDEKSAKMLKGFRHTVAPKGSGCPTNYDIAAGAARGKIIIQAQDDIIPPSGWDEMILDKIEDLDAPVFLAVADGQRTDRLCVSTVMTRAYMEQKKAEDADGSNGFMHRSYTGVFADTENTYRAYTDAKKGRCQLIEARDIILFHDHPAFNQAVPWDETYAQENSSEANKIGSEVFNRRFPDAKSDGVLELPPGESVAREELEEAAA